MTRSTSCARCAACGMWWSSRSGCTVPQHRCLSPNEKGQRIDQRSPALCRISGRGSRRRVERRDARRRKETSQLRPRGVLLDSLLDKRQLRPLCITVYHLTRSLLIRPEALPAQANRQSPSSTAPAPSRTRDPFAEYPHQQGSAKQNAVPHRLDPGPLLSTPEVFGPPRTTHRVQRDRRLLSPQDLSGPSRDREACPKRESSLSAQPVRVKQDHVACFSLSRWSVVEMKHRPSGASGKRMDVESDAKLALLPPNSDDASVEVVRSRTWPIEAGILPDVLPSIPRPPRRCPEPVRFVGVGRPTNLETLGFDLCDGLRGEQPRRLRLRVVLRHQLVEFRILGGALITLGRHRYSP